MKPASFTICLEHALGATRSEIPPRCRSSRNVLAAYSSGAGVKTASRNIGFWLADTVNGKMLWMQNWEPCLNKWGFRAGLKGVSVTDKKLSPVLENYLEIIFLHELRDGAVRASDVADFAGVTRSTVTSALKTLQKMGYVEYEPYSLIHLTKEGMRVGREIAHRHIVLQEFFQHVLQLDEKVASSVSCELEHVLPGEVMLRLGQFVLYLQEHMEGWQNWFAEYEKSRPAHPRRLRDAELLRRSPHALPPRTGHGA